MKKKKIAIYARVSSSTQNLDSQMPDLQRWAKSQDCEVLWFSEKVSGLARIRPEWDRLHELILSEKIAALVCWRLDRLGRSASQLTKLFEELQQHKVNLISLRDNIDLSTASGRLMANMLAVIAMHETEVRVDRIKAGISASKAKGKKWGGRPKGIPLKVTKNHISAAKQLKGEGVPVTDIAKTLKLSRQTIYTLLAS